MSDRNPSVSCIIATRNRKHVVDRAIKSVLDQTYPCTELLIIDDAGVDQTFEYLEKRYANHSKISILQNKKQMGPAATRNRGIDLANGKYICFLDDDDQWKPNKIKCQVALAEQGYDFITMTRAEYILDNHSIFKYGPKLKVITLRDLFRRNAIISVTPLIRTSLMRRIGFDTKMWCGEDYDAWIRLLKTDVTTINVNDPLVVLHKTAGTSLNQIRKNKFQGRKQIYTRHKALMNSKEKILFAFMTALKLILPDPRYHQKRIQQFIKTLISVPYRKI